MADLNAIVDSLSSLTVLEAAELVKQLEAKWGVSAAAKALGVSRNTIYRKKGMLPPDLLG